MTKIKCTVCNGEKTYFVSKFSFDGDSDRMYSDEMEEEYCDNCDENGMEELELNR